MEKSTKGPASTQSVQDVILQILERLVLTPGRHWTVPQYCISKLCHACFYKSQSCSKTSPDQIKGKLDQLSDRYKNHPNELSTLDWTDNVKVSYDAKLT